MDFVIDKVELLRELHYVQGVVERKTTVPILSNLLLEAREDGLAVTATDLDVTMRCACDARVESAGALAVSARKLFDIIRLLPDAPVHFKSVDEGWVHIDCQRSKFKIAGLARENFPEIPSAVESFVSLPAAALRYMINRTIFAVTHEESRYALNGGLMILNGSSMTLVTTDGHRLALIRKRLESAALEEEVRILVPKKTLIELGKMSEDVDSVRFGHTDNHLFFNMGRRRLVSRVLTGQFPNYDMVIPRENDCRAGLNTEQFCDALKRVQVMADEQLRGVRFALKSGEVRVSSASADFGEATEAVPAEYDGGEIEISFNAQYLLDFLSGLSSEEVNFDLRDAETQGLLSPKDSGDYTYQYVVMPMKM